MDFIRARHLPVNGGGKQRAQFFDFPPSPAGEVSSAIQRETEGGSRGGQIAIRVGSNARRYYSRGAGHAEASQPFTL